MIQIGPYTIQSIETGSFALDGGAMFGVVPKTLWEKTNPADDKNRIDMRARALLIQKSPDSSNPEALNILVDCGMGEKWNAKFKEIYKVDHLQWSLDRSLKAKGLCPEDITDVIATHLHFDHVGGLTYLEDPNNPDSELLPSFPNARLWVQKRNWDLAWSPNEKDRASYLTENYSIYKNSKDLSKKLQLIQTPSVDPTGESAYSDPKSEETEIYPGIKVRVSHGHTPGMQLVKVSDSNQSLLYCADLIPTSSHVRIPFIMAYDCYPIFILKEKKQVLRKAVEENTILFYEHCPHHIATRIVQTPKGDFTIGESVEL